MRAFLKNYRQSPRKVRLVADLARGKSVESAEALLKNLPKRAAGPLLKLIRSAAANARHNHKLAGNLFVKSLRVDAGQVFKRWKPAARGSAHPFKKRTSRVTVVLEEKPRT